MNPGGLAQMSSNNFASHNGFGNPGGLASRRGGQNIKPLSFDAVTKAADKENTVPTPRTSRSHLLAGLRTAPKSATTGSFGLASPNPTQQYARGNGVPANNGHGMGQDSIYNNAPKTAFPQYGGQQQQQQQQQQQAQMQMNNAHLMGQQYTVDQVLAPPDISFDDQAQEQMDPGLYAQLVATNMYLAQQQQRLQQQLRSVQAAAQQFQQLNLNNHPQLVQQQMAIYEQQNQLRSMQQQLGAQAAATQVSQPQQQQQQQQQFYYNPMTGQYYVDTPSQMASQLAPSYQEQQPMTPGSFGGLQQQHNQQQQQMYQGLGQIQTPRVQVSPPPETLSQSNGYRSNSPSKRGESPQETQPLPPPSANAFRRGHKKASSLAPLNSSLASGAGSNQPPSAGPKSAFPMTPMTGGYGPGQGRAGEHPIRQPRGPPSMDELKLKPTAKHEGSKNFATRTRRSAVHNLVRAGLERRKGTGSSNGSMSPVSETAEESSTPITDNDSESGRSGSGSLVGEEECSSTVRKTNGGGWGAIGSDRPNSSQRSRQASESESDASSFAHVFKNGAQRASKADEAGERRAPRLVLTNSDKRRTAAPTA